MRKVGLAIGIFLGGKLYAQIESPNSFLGLSVGVATPTGPTSATGFTYPTHGYAQEGAAIGLHLSTFVAPYIGISLRLSQSFLPLNAKALGKSGALFPEPVYIAKNPTVSHTTVGVGLATGLRLTDVDWLSFYVPLQFALGIYALPEIQGVKSATQTWVQPKFSTVQAGISTGLLMNFSITDDFFAGISLLYTTLQSGEKDFTRQRYDKSVPDWTYVYRSSVRVDLAEVGVLVGLNF